MMRHPVRFAVVGLGAFGATYLTCLRGRRQAAGVEVVAVCLRPAKRAQALATRYEVPRWDTDVEALAGDPQVAVACIVTAEPDHCRPALACLAAGRDVIVEKPLATRLDEADAMIAAAQRADRRLMVGHLLRFDVLYAAPAERIAAGELGALVLLHTRRHRPAPATRRCRRTHSLLEMGILDVDVMLWLTGAHGRRLRAVNPGPTLDLGWAMREFESGPLGCLETSWLAPAGGGVCTDDALSVVGRRGTARLDLARAPLAPRTEAGYRLPDIFYEPRAASAVGGARRERSRYVSTCVRQERAPERVPPAEVRHGLAVTRALIRSAEEGRDQLVAELG
jgi:UDP-N-acetylglucosamine 3-dehydrogenase